VPSEIVLSGGLNAVCPVSKVDLVEIEVEDLSFVQFPFDPIGQDRLSDLSAVGYLTVQKKFPGDLLGYGAPPLGTLALPD
jgi:hypothetical protein